MLRVYYGDVTHLANRPESYCLSQYRLEKLARLKPELARKQTIGAELLLIHALREYWGQVELPLSIQKGENGKPYLAGREIYFNCSHSGSFAACVVSDRPVGLDLQQRSTYQERIARRFFSEDEQQAIRGEQDRDAAYTEIWSKKESYLKARRLGLSVSLSSFSVFSPEIAPNLWHQVIEEMHFSVCVLEGNPIPEQMIKRELW